MNVVDTSGWLEYFAGSENGAFFASAIEDTTNLLVPVICVYEVFKKVLQSQGQAMAETHKSDLPLAAIDPSLGVDGSRNPDQDHCPLASVASFKNDESGRLLALARADILDTAAEAPFEAITDLVCQILQVPVSFLFEGGPGGTINANGVSEAPSPTYVSDFLATSEGLALTRAFTRINDSKLRRSIVDLVEQIALREQAERHCQPPR